MLFIVPTIAAQDNKYSDVEIFDLKGATHNLSYLFEENITKPFLLFFWDTNDPHAYDLISDFLEINKDSINNDRMRIASIILGNDIPSIQAYISGHNLDMDVFIDRNGSAKRKFGINKSVHAIVFDKYRRELWKSNLPCSGSKK